MKKLSLVLSVLSLIPSLALARGRSGGYSGHRSGGSSFSAGRGGTVSHYTPQTSHMRGFTSAPSARSVGARSRMTGGRTGVTTAPTPVTPGVPAVEGAFIRDNAMFVKQQPTGEGSRWYGPSAGGVLVASDDGKAQPLYGAGAFMGRPDYQTGDGATSSGGIGTFYSNTSK